MTKIFKFVPYFEENGDPVSVVLEKAGINPTEVDEFNKKFGDHELSMLETMMIAKLKSGDWDSLTDFQKPFYLLDLLKDMRAQLYTEMRSRELQSAEARGEDIE